MALIKAIEYHGLYRVRFDVMIRKDPTEPRRAEASESDQLVIARDLDQAIAMGESLVDEREQRRPKGYGVAIRDVTLLRRDVAVIVASEREELA